MIQVFFSFGSKCVLLENSLTPLEGGRGKGGGGGGGTVGKLSETIELEKSQEKNWLI